MAFRALTSFRAVATRAVAGLPAITAIRAMSSSAETAEQLASLVKSELAHEVRWSSPVLMALADVFVFPLLFAWPVIHCSARMLSHWTSL